MSMYTRDNASAYNSSVQARTGFIRYTYVHLSAAIALFVAFTTLFYKMGVGETFIQVLSAGRGMWLLFLGGFVVLGYVAQMMARSTASQGLQYAGLTGYTILEALIFSPMIYIAARFAPDALPTAAILTLVTFSGLSAYVLTTKKDFSFLRGAIVVGSLVGLGLIVAGALFGLSLGIWFSAGMVLLSAGAVLYSTSKVVNQYRADQYVAAALELFAAIALMFWYVLRIVLATRR